MKRKNSFAIIASAVIFSVTQSATADETELRPLLSVADFNGDGIVDRRDINRISRAISQSRRSGEYIAFFDYNADERLDGRDIAAATLDLGLESSALDQQIVQWYNIGGHFQNKGKEYLTDYGFNRFTPSLKGHGEHWMNAPGFAALSPGNHADKNSIQGLNLATEGDQTAKALFWGEAAIPLFNDPNAPDGLSTLDWPHGTAWMSERVQAFAGHAPKFTDSHHEKWHTHAGLCGVYDDAGEIHLHQHTSFVECQSYYNARPRVIGQNPETGEPVMGNAWVNIWMVHVWLYELNPDGIFAGTLHGLDPGAKHEGSINDGREVPMYFRMHHGDH